MNICVLVDAWEPIWGGGQTHVWEISRRLVTKFGCQVNIYTRALKSENGIIYDKNLSFLNGKLTVIRGGTPTFFFQPWGRISWIFQIIRLVISAHRKNPYSIIYAHAYSAGIPAKILRTLLRIPTVFTVHGCNNLDLRPWSVIGILERILLTRLKYDAEISVSHHFLNYPNSNRVYVIPNGVSKYNYLKLKKKPFTKFTLLWVGRFDPVKGLDVLIRAFSHISNRNKSVKLLLVGNGPELNHIKALVKSLALQKQVQFLGKKSGRDLAKVYLSANAFVLPSYSEGHPITLFEAWAAKLPVIASRVGDIPEYVKHGVNGFLVKPGDIAGLAQTLEQVIKTNNDHLGRAGFKTIARYTWDASAQKVYAVLDKVIQNFAL